MTEDDLHQELMGVLVAFDIPFEYAESLIDTLHSASALDHLEDEEDEEYDD